VQEGWTSVLGIGQEFSLNILYPIGVGDSTVIFWSLIYLLIYFILSKHLRQKFF